MTSLDSNISINRPWPTLYHKGSSGQMYQWQVWVEGSDIVAEYGVVGGKFMEARKRAEAKNVGRSNETTPFAQAQLEAEAMYKFKLERKYCVSIRECEDPLFLPMLAHKFQDKKNGIGYPVWVQPKLDGVRCIARWHPRKPEIQLLTRAGKEWDIPHVKKELEIIMPTDMVLDGELYIHGKSFQDISKLVKKHRPETLELEFHIYDVPVAGDDFELPFEERFAALLKVEKKIEETGVQHMKVVPTRPANSEAEVYEAQGDCIECGYEGAMVRTRGGFYSFGYRSSDLLKVKTFQDNEFDIVGFHPGVGKFSECVIWECVTKDGTAFNCVPRGTFEDRKEWLENGDEYVGQMLKVKYQDLTDDGIPRFPVGIGFRLPEDT